MSAAEILGPWYYLSRLFGYFPSMTLRGYGLILTLVLSLINIALHSFLGWNIPIKFSYLQTAIGSRVEKTFNVVDSAVPITAILSNFLLLGRAKNLFRLLYTADELLREVRVTVSQKHLWRYAGICLSMVLFMHLLPLIILPTVSDDSQYYMDLLPIAVYMTYRQLSNISFLGSITLILIAVFIRLKSVNVSLTGNFLHTPPRVVGISLATQRYTADDPIFVVGVLASIHQILCETIEEINNAFSFQVGFKI